jgi:hypothetical protein
MEPKEAVSLAKRFVRELFAEENITEIGLEELDYDPDPQTWMVTVGFRRPWARHPETMNSLFPSGFAHLTDRWYKQVLVDGNTGYMRSIRDRELKDAA